MKSKVIYEGMNKAGFAGIDGEFMIKNDIVIAVLVSGGEGAVMVHPQFDPAKGDKLIPVLAELNQQAVATLHAAANADGKVH